MPHHETLSLEQLAALKVMANEYIERHNTFQSKYIMEKIHEVVKEWYEETVSCPTHVHMHPSVATALGEFLGGGGGQVIKQIETDSGSILVVEDNNVRLDQLRFIEREVRKDATITWNPKRDK